MARCLEGREKVIEGGEVEFISCPACNCNLVRVGKTYQLQDYYLEQSTTTHFRFRQVTRRSSNFSQTWSIFVTIVLWVGSPSH